MTISNEQGCVLRCDDDTWTAALAIAHQNGWTSMDGTACEISAGDAEALAEALEEAGGDVAELIQLCKTGGLIHPMTSAKHKGKVVELPTQADNPRLLQSIRVAPVWLVLGAGVESCPSSIGRPNSPRAGAAVVAGTGTAWFEAVLGHNRGGPA